MRSLLRNFLLATAALCSTSLLAGENLLRNGDFSQGLQEWNVREAAGSITPVEEAGGAQPRFVRVEVQAEGKKPWDVQLRQVLSTDIVEGEQVVLTAMMRSPGNLEAALSIQPLAPPIVGIAFGKKALSGEWQRVQVRGRAKHDALSGKAQLVLNLGTGTGTIEVADVRLELPDRENGGSPSAAIGKRPPAPPRELPEVDLTGIPGSERIPGEHHRSLVAGVREMRLGGAENGKIEIVPVEEMPFKEAARIHTTRQTDHPYEIQATTPTLGPVRKGDVLLAIFFFRPFEPNRLAGFATTEFVFEERGGTFAKSVHWGTSGSSGWQQIVVPFHAKGDYAPGKAGIVFRAGFGEQAFDIGGLVLLNLGSEVSIADLPQTPRTYGGREPDAAWRSEARERIEKIRKGDARVTIADASGQPLGDAHVSVTLKRHAFGFGTAINIDSMPGSPKAPKDGRYAKTAEELFNCGVFENEMKWKAAGWPGIVENIRRNLDWMKERHWMVRGHTAIWPAWRRSPAELQALANDPARLRQATNERVREIVQRYAGEIHAWDVINEPFLNNDFMKILGDEVMADWFKIAAEADPNALLFLNDNQIVSDPSPVKRRLHYYLDLTQRLRKSGARVDGLGMQSHFGWHLPSIGEVLQVFDQAAANHLRIHITEFDIAIDDEALQADYTRDFMTAVFSHPGTEAFIMWGFWAGQHWRPEAAMFRKDWTLRPWGEVYRDLVFKEWSTREQGATDARGQFAFRGFYGDYDVKVEREGKTLHGSFSLRKGASPATVTVAVQ